MSSDDPLGILASRKKQAKPRTDPERKLKTQLARLDALTRSREISPTEATKLRLQVTRAAEGVNPRLASAEDKSALGKVVRTSGSLAQGLLRELGRPGNAVSAGVAEAVRGSVRGVPLLPNPVRVAKAAQEGFDLKRQDTVSSVAKEFGVDLPKPVAVAADVVGSAVLDPLTYVSGGTGAAAKTAVRMVGKQVGKEAAEKVAKGGLKALSAGERQAVEATLTPRMQAALRSAQGGLSVRTPTLSRPTGPLLQRAGIQSRPGLAAPRTVVPGHAFAKATAPAKPLFSAIGKSRPAIIAQDVFVPRAGVQREHGSDIAAAIDDARVRARGTEATSVEDDIERLARVAKEANVTQEELTTIVGPALDLGQQPAVPARLRPLTDELRALRQELTDAQVSAGLLPEAVTEFTEQYLPRILTPKGREFLERSRRERGFAPPRPAPVSSPASVSAIADPARTRRRLMVESPVNEINETLREKVGGDLFDPDPLRAFAQRSRQARRSLAAKQFLDDVGRITTPDGAPILRPMSDFVPEGKTLDDVRLPLGTEKIEVKGVGSFVAPKEVAREVKRLVDVQINDEALGSLVRGIDRWMQLWKGYATVPLVFGLGFHERNAMGNVFNNYLRGINPGSGAYRQAAGIQRQMQRGRAVDDQLSLLSPEQREIVQLMRQHNVIGESFFNVDLPTDITRRVRPGKRTTEETARAVIRKSNPLNPDNAVLSSGRRFGSAIENNARMAHFIHVYKETGDAAEAARSVRKYLFDYSDLTAAEQQVFKRIHAFYTFTRKNLPLQVANLMQQPGKFSRYQHVREALAGQAQPTEGPYPEYLDEMAGTPLPLGVSNILGAIPGSGFKRDEQVALAPDLPFLAAADTLQGPAALASRLPLLNRALPEDHKPISDTIAKLLNENIVGGAPGAVMTAAQLAAGKEFFSGRALREGQREPAPYYAVPYAQRRVVDGENQPSLTTRSRFAAEQTMPLLGKVATFFPRGERDAAKAPRRRLSALTGLRAVPLNEGTQRGELYRRSDTLGRIISDYEGRGVTVPKTRRRSNRRRSGR